MNKNKDYIDWCIRLMWIHQSFKMYNALTVDRIVSVNEYVPFIDARRIVGHGRRPFNVAAIAVAATATLHTSLSKSRIQRFTTHTHFDTRFYTWNNCCDIFEDFDYYYMLEYYCFFHSFVVCRVHRFKLVWFSKSKLRLVVSRQLYVYCIWLELNGLHPSSFR